MKYITMSFTHTQTLRIIAHTLEHGGGTFDITGNFGPVGGVFAPTSGYAVSLKGGYSFYLDERDSLVDLVGLFENVIDQVLKRIDTPSVLFIGTWIDGNAAMPKAYVDPVVFVPGRKEALLLASKEGQKAFYDFAAGDSIFLTPADRND